jgi:hypothetical protein
MMPLTLSDVDRAEIERIRRTRSHGFLVPLLEDAYLAGKRAGIEEALAAAHDATKDFGTKSKSCDAIRALLEPKPKE